MKVNIDTTAMKIILNAGNAREEMKKALEALVEDNEAEYFERMKEAKEKIRTAHQCQTSTIQQQASGVELEINLLFIHAQDTLMTIMSEKNMIESMKLLYDKLKKSTY
ncbi:PTS lactose/cellobiose transporter subunit IIA [Enterococcus saccharolyticus]|uniref:PTS lactose/cellobiose transporter subunit IIA n=1 Tax=Candidatus Enterococcus willemsii TaxID=1857215 RepID=A0ABQ6Z1V4_9ENTE|nr:MULTISPECIES: PTS lactose/cellobiose transporter subunit IIA [Enterococcus]KAF1305012.1 hypothetical protein BAU17_12875 [Enterococcus sp. CU12B]MCD5003542.1 PTS lactose/cellobiose transporter subunit IIA [Enterococcus saccharolyticus]